MPLVCWTALTLPLLPRGKRAHYFLTRRNFHAYDRSRGIAHRYMDKEMSQPGIPYDTSLIRRVYEENRRSREESRQGRLKEATSLLQGYFARTAVKRAFILGSLTQPYMYTERSDIDIAVEGMEPSTYFQVFGDLEDLLGTERIGLIEMERCGFRDYIEAHGVRVK